MIQYQKWECGLQPDVALPLLVQPIKDSISEVGVRLNDLYLKTFKPKTLNTEHWTRNASPFSRTPTSKIHVFCNQHQVGGRPGLYVALPLLVQPIKDSISEVGVRLIDLYLKTFKPKTRNIEHGTLHPLVALPHLRFTFSATNTKWEGD